MKTLQLKSLVLILVGLAVAAGAIYGVYVFASREPDAAAKVSVKPALTVTTAQPQSTQLPITLAANGNIVAWQEAIIGSESNGLRLTDVRANVGDVVRAGQVLATFSTATVQADVAQARASLVEAQASAAEALANADRARTLQNSGALSAQQINQYTTAAQTAQARVEAAQAVLGAQQIKGRQTEVLAPDSGVISARTATVGAVVGVGTELFRLIRKGRLEWRAEVTSAELGRITAGTPVTVRPASGGEVQGRVRMIAPTVDPQTRAALVYVDLPSMLSQRSAPPGGTLRPAQGDRGSEVNGCVGQVFPQGRPKEKCAPPGGRELREASDRGGHILPGMFARGEFALGASGAMTVPQRALVLRDGFTYVFQLAPDNRVSQVKVQTGRLAGDRVEVLSGLAADARIAVDGAGFLNDGDLVRVSDAAAAPVAVPGVIQGSGASNFQPNQLSAQSALAQPAIK